MRLSKSRKVVLAAGTGLPILALLALSSIVTDAHFGVLGTKDPVRSISDDDDSHDRPLRVGDLIIPESWAGLWNVTTRFNDATTGNVVASDESTDSICPRDEVGLLSFITPPREEDDDDPSDNGLAATCTGQALSDRLDVDCSSQFTSGDCTLNFLFQLKARRDIDQLLGQGEWRIVKASGNCSASLGQGELFKLSGTRLSRDLKGCSAVPSTLIEKFVQHPDLILLLPAPIADLSAQGRNKKIDLSWTAPPQASAYRIFRARQHQPFELIAVKRAKKEAAFRDYNVFNGISYRYVIRWLDRDGRQSPSSNEVTATPGGHQD